MARSRSRVAGWVGGVAVYMLIRGGLNMAIAAHDRAQAKQQERARQQAAFDLKVQAHNCARPIQPIEPGWLEVGPPPADRRQEMARYKRDMQKYESDLQEWKAEGEQLVQKQRALDRQ